MKAYEFSTKLTEAGTLEIPSKFAKKLPRNQDFRMILLVNEADDEEDNKAWYRLSTEQFFAGFAESDAVYDEMK